MGFMPFGHAAFCIRHGAFAVWTWGVFISSWGVSLSVMGHIRSAATSGWAASPLPAIRRRMGNEDVAPPWFCKCLYKRRRINENMVWTDSQDYDADEILYTARTVLFDKTNRLMRKIPTLFEVYPRLFYPVVPWLFFPKGVSLDSPNALSFPLRLIIRSKHQFCGAP